VTIHFVVEHSQLFDQLSPELRGCRADAVCLLVKCYAAVMKVDMLQR